MRILPSLLIILILFSCKPENTSEFEADIIIYGGTSAAITAAVQAKKMGKSVIVVSPDMHLGGLSSGGLGFTDTGNKSVIGGLAREFYHRIYLHYQQDSAWKWQKKEEYGNKGQGTPAMDGENRTMWIFEPHAAERVFEDFVKENDLEIHRDDLLKKLRSESLSPAGLRRGRAGLEPAEAKDLGWPRIERPFHPQRSVACQRAVLQPVRGQFVHRQRYR